MHETRKSLNTKVVQNSKSSNFSFRHFSVWSFIWKLKFETRVCLKISYTLRDSNFSSIFVWQIEKLGTWKLFDTWKPTTLILGKSSFEQYFKSYFQHLFTSFWIKSSFRVTTINLKSNSSGKKFQHQLGCILMHFICHLMVRVKSMLSNI